MSIFYQLNVKKQPIFCKLVSKIFHTTTQTETFWEKSIFYLKEKYTTFIQKITYFFLFFIQHMCLHKYYVYVYKHLTL